MNRTHTKASPPTRASRWPNLQHKYGKLGNPAVVAAVAPGYGPSRRSLEAPSERPAAEPRQNGGTPFGATDGDHGR
jgi:hypothetical protein